MRPRDHVCAGAGRLGPGDRCVGCVARVGGHDHRVLEERGALGDRGELLRELAEGEVQGAALDQAEGGRVPERGRAAVAERDLVALGSEKRLLRPARTSPTSALTGFCLWEVPMTAAPASARCASACGRTFDGPQPKRPSAGFSSSGMDSAVFAVHLARRHVGSSLCLTGRESSVIGGVPRRAAVMARRSPVVRLHPSASRGDQRECSEPAAGRAAARGRSAPRPCGSSSRSPGRRG